MPTPVNDINRSKIAREHAGLSVGQAAKLFNITTAELNEIEAEAQLSDILEPLSIGVLCAYYGVSVEWITGVVARRDYASIDKIKGADELSFHDRDVLAEFAAAMPRDNRTKELRFEICRKKQP